MSIIGNIVNHFYKFSCFLPAFKVFKTGDFHGSLAVPFYTSTTSSRARLLTAYRSAAFMSSSVRKG
jgi:hypothetical protein